MNNNFFIFVFSLLFSACVTRKGYSGASLPAGELATVVAHGVAFESANGIPVGVLSSSIEIPAGKNELLLTINASNFNDADNAQRQYKLTMLAEGGKTYAITGRRGDARLCAFPLLSSGDPDFNASAGCVER